MSVQAASSGGGEQSINQVNLDLLRQEFDQNGYILLQNILRREEVEKYLAVMQELDRTITSTVKGKRQPGDPLEVRNAVTAAPAIADLVDHPAILPVIAGLMGYNIQVNTTHAFMRPPFPPGTSLEVQKGLAWHHDVPGTAGPVNGQLPWLYTRVGFFLTEHSVPNSGSLKVVPGTHRVAGRPAWPKGSDDPYGAVEVVLKAGDVIVFDNRLWHASAPNFADHTRVNVYVGYSWRWMRPIDYRFYPDEFLAPLSPIRRQLFGDNLSPLGHIFPTDEDVPLKQWMKDQGIAPLVKSRPQAPS